MAHAFMEAAFLDSRERNEITLTMLRPDAPEACAVSQHSICAPCPYVHCDRIGHANEGRRRGFARIQGLLAACQMDQRRFQRRQDRAAALGLMRLKSAIPRGQHVSPYRSSGASQCCLSGPIADGAGVSLTQTIVEATLLFVDLAIGE